MNAIKYVLHLTEPVLATQPHKGEPNSAISLPYIPGSMIRGALVRALKGAGKKDIVAADQRERKLFFDEVSFLHAYPGVAAEDDLARSLPTPLSWFVTKDKINESKGDIVDSAHSLQDLNQPKNIKQPFCHIARKADGTLHASMLNPEKMIMVHNASTNRNQKSRGSSQVFRYESLAAGQQLVGFIISNELDHLKFLKENGFDAYPRLPLGGSHNSGYGMVEVVACDIIEDWPGETPTAGQVANAGGVTVTLLSDLLARSAETGYFETDLSAVFGAVTTSKKYQKSELVGGFNRHWGLQLPQHHAIAAGSVLVISEPDAECINRLKEWEKTGLGERTAEGFGRIALNWHTAADLTYKKESVSTKVNTGGQSPASQAMVDKVAGRMLRKSLDKQLVVALQKMVGFGSKKGLGQNLHKLPSMSQLSGVRLAARKAIATKNRSLVADHLNGQRKTVKNYWKKSRIKGEDLTTWLIKHSDMNAATFNSIFLGSDGSDGVEVSDEMRAEYSNRLVEGVIKVALEVKRDENEAGGSA